MSALAVLGKSWLSVATHKLANITTFPSYKKPALTAQYTVTQQEDTQ